MRTLQIQEPTNHAPITSKTSDVKMARYPSRIATVLLAMRQFWQRSLVKRPEQGEHSPRPQLWQVAVAGPEGWA